MGECPEAPASGSVRSSSAIAEGKVIVLTGPEHTHAEQNAIRRAARTLERAGRLQVVPYRVDGRSRLVACPVEMKVPQGRRIDGIDGKVYWDAE